MVRYVCPKGVGRDNNDHHIANLVFSVPTDKLDAPASLERWINANINCDESRNADASHEVKSVSLDFAETLGTARFLTIPHTRLHAFKIKRDKEDASSFHLVFKARVECDKSNCEFILMRSGTDVALTVHQTEADLAFSEAQDEAEASAGELTDAEREAIKNQQSKIDFGDGDKAETGAGGKKKAGSGKAAARKAKK